MNTHDIELPPLPVGTTSPMVHGAYYYASDMHDYAREAIEPYTKRIAALEAARIAYASEFAPNKDGDPDVGRIHENIRKLKADRKRRGEPVAWQLRLPDGRVKLEKEYPVWADGSDGYSIKSLYATPQPTEPTPAQKRHARLRTDPAKATALNRALERIAVELSSSAEPVKEPSDLPHALRDLVAIWRKQQGEYPAEGKQAAAAVRLCANELELLLARYDHPAEPEGWQLVPKEPTEEMLAATSWPNCAGTDYSHMLKAAPKLGEEE